jgi:hypothetical protein
MKAVRAIPMGLKCETAHSVNVGIRTTATPGC